MEQAEGMAEVTLQLMGPAKARAFVTRMCSRLRPGKLLHDKCALTRAMKYLPQTQVSDEMGDLLVLSIPHWPKRDTEPEILWRTSLRLVLLK